MTNILALKAKNNLIKYVEEIDKRLVRCWKEEINLGFGFNQKQKHLVEQMLIHSQEHNLRAAKRLRASFVHYGYLLSGKSVTPGLWQVAMGVELVHTALLIHDDFMDQDDIRRGGPTTHKYFENGDTHYGVSMAVNIGDAVLEIGQELLLAADFDPDLVREATLKMLRGVANTAWGQAYDVTLEKMKDEWTEDDVMTVHKAKTAIYTYENPLFIGAILAGLGDEVLGILHDYSMDGGVAFQLQDDILGVYGDPKRTGKSANSDLLQGKCTLLVMKVFKEGSEEQIRTLEKVWGKRKADQEVIDKAKKAIRESGSLEYSTKISREYAARAAKTADKLRGLRLNKEAIDYVQGIALYMVERDL